MRHITNGERMTGTWRVVGEHGTTGAEYSAAELERLAELHGAFFVYELGNDRVVGGNGQLVAERVVRTWTEEDDARR